eukprot:CAMPEP_0177343300 /NCGR_PEP_ID=MMETSP0368-20130122/27503_1 /TAXON_ID=447022 ORGANISM="Scrippsiella hangoei-like, Strain SHHI-4" /NCGR_SAMPLE_ID=MMETSP0368 /ASSEMBLY_ACC=CAM_ASM_000363 /LENGTH=33 /DNA_ID= /DNA_START= /DNA_END= /DNA_ORIENTATION=
MAKAQSGTAVEPLGAVELGARMATQESQWHSGV